LFFGEIWGRAHEILHRKLVVASKARRMVLRVGSEASDEGGGDGGGRERH
jgi:hypothetical protein